MNNPITDLDFFTQLIPKTLSYYNKKEIDSVQEFSLGLLDRLYKSNISLKLLLQNIDSTPELEFSAGIIVRAMILDILIGLSFYKLLKDNLSKGLSNEEFKNLVQEFCNKILADGLDNLAQSLKMAKDFGYINSHQLKAIYDNISINHKRFLKLNLENGAIPESKYGRGDSPTTLFKKLASDSAMKKIAGIYDLYLFYSKYDHFGILYFETRNITIEEKKSRLFKAIGFFRNHCANLYDILERVSQKDKFIGSQLKIVEDYLK